MRVSFILLSLCMVYSCLFAQKQKADSLYKLLAKEKIDTNRATLMWEIGNVAYLYDPVTALEITSEGLSLSKQIKYLEGPVQVAGCTCQHISKVRKLSPCPGI